jgi:hypothetical protein
MPQKSGALREIRTPDLRNRNPMLVERKEVP